MNRRRRARSQVLAALVATCFAAATSGCSMFGPRTQRLTVWSEPPGADVLVNGEMVGMTPLETRIRRWNRATITVQRAGYRPVTRATTSSLSGLGITDVVFGTLVLFPYFGLLSGAAWEQTPDHLQLNLQEE